MLVVGYLKNLPELISYAAEPGQKVTNEEGLGHAVAPQHDQALAQVLWSRQLRSKSQWLNVSLMH